MLISLFAFGANVTVSSNTLYTAWEDSGCCETDDCEVVFSTPSEQMHCAKSGTILNLDLNIDLHR